MKAWGHCPLCESEAVARRFQLEERMFGTGEIFPYVECSHCRSLRIEDLPEDISAHYRDRYYTRIEAGSPIVRWLLARRDAAALTGRGVVGRAVGCWHPSEGLSGLANAELSLGARILDVGCGSGSMLRALAACGYRNLKGADPFIDRDLRYGDSVTIRRARTCDLSGTHDLVMFHHSLEHIPDPLAELEAARRLLDAETGRCLVRVPTVSSWAWRHYGLAWVQLDPPRHLFLPSVEGLEAVLARAGFKVESVEYDSSSFQIWGSEQVERGVPIMSRWSIRMNPIVAAVRLPKLVAAARLATTLNEDRNGDQLAVWARPDSA